MASTRIRVPDVAIFRRDAPVQSVFTHPPLIALEVLSPEDRVVRLNRTVNDLMRFGASHIWFVDPAFREAWDCSNGDRIRTERLAILDSPIHLDIPELFRSIENDEA